MKKIVKVILFIVLFCLFLHCCDKILMVKLLAQPWDNYYKMEGFYQEPEDTLDVVFMGSSIQFCSINPMTLWEEYGFTSYVFANGGQTIQFSYYYLQEVLKHQNPKVVILEVSTLDQTLKTMPVDTTFVWNMANTPFSLEKSSIIFNCVEKWEWWDAFFPITYYHSRWKELNRADFEIPFTNIGRNVSKGSSYSFYEEGVSSFETLTGREINSRDYHLRDGKTIDEVTIEYLSKFVEYAKKRGVDVILLKTPKLEDWSQDYNDSIQAFAEYHDIEYWNYADPDMIFDDISKAYMDRSHLNYWGSTQYSKMIGGALMDEYTFRDKRSDDGYTYWWEDLKRYKEKVMDAMTDYEQMIEGSIQ